VQREPHPHVPQNPRVTRPKEEVALLVQKWTVFCVIIEHTNACLFLFSISHPSDFHFFDLVLSGKVELEVYLEIA